VQTSDRYFVTRKVGEPFLKGKANNYTVKDNDHISLLVISVAEGLTSVKQIDGRIRG